MFNDVSGLEFVFGMKLFPCLQLLPICNLQVDVVSGPQLSQKHNFHQVYSLTLGNTTT